MRKSSEIGRKEKEKLSASSSLQLSSDRRKRRGEEKYFSSDRKKRRKRRPLFFPSVFFELAVDKSKASNKTECSFLFFVFVWCWALVDPFSLGLRMWGADRPPLRKESREGKLNDSSLRNNYQLDSLTKKKHKHTQKIFVSLVEQLPSCPESANQIVQFIDTSFGLISRLKISSVAPYIQKNKGFVCLSSNDKLFVIFLRPPFLLNTQQRYLFPQSKTRPGTSTQKGI